MKVLRHAKNWEVVTVYHHVVMGLSFLKDCPLLTAEDFTNRSIMTAGWFNNIVDWLVSNYPDEFTLE